MVRVASIVDAGHGTSSWPSWSLCALLLSTSPASPSEWMLASLRAKTAAQHGAWATAPYLHDHFQVRNLLGDIICSHCQRRMLCQKNGQAGEELLWNHAMRAQRQAESGGVALERGPIPIDCPSLVQSPISTAGQE
jgi:hypothetical protein